MRLHTMEVGTHWRIKRYIKKLDERLPKGKKRKTVVKYENLNGEKYKV